jgi:hypothetical protein
VYTGQPLNVATFDVVAVVDAVATDAVDAVASLALAGTSEAAAVGLDVDAAVAGAAGPEASVDAPVTGGVTDSGDDPPPLPAPEHAANARARAKGKTRWIRFSKIDLYCFGVITCARPIRGSG